MVQNLVGNDDIPNLGCVEPRMVYCWVTPLYLSPSHLVEGDESCRGIRYCDALGSYMKGNKDIGWVGVGVVATGQSTDATEKYGKE
jgi:hypothetical protein